MKQFYFLLLFLTQARFSFFFSFRKWETEYWNS